MTEIKGIDVSSWQNEIDWSKVKADGIDFAMIRVGTGTNQDKYFITNINSAIKNNINCGVYLYSYATTTDMAKKEAEFVLKCISPYKITFPVVYDIEDKVQHNLSNKQRTDLIEAFCSTIENGGYKAGIYTSLSWFNTMLDLSRIEKYEKWVAQWNAAKCSFAGEVSIWQNSSTGRVSGIKGNVDTNICYKDYLNINSNINKSYSNKVTPANTDMNIKRTGKKINLTKTPLFISSEVKAYSAIITGTYWIYDEKIINSRVRITDNEASVSKLPIEQNVIGFINISDA